MVWIVSVVWFCFAGGVSFDDILPVILFVMSWCFFGGGVNRFFLPHCRFPWRHFVFVRKSTLHNQSSAGRDWLEFMLLLILWVRLFDVAFKVSLL